jgi:hypothetical protein
VHEGARLAAMLTVSEDNISRHKKGAGTSLIGHRNRCCFNIRHVIRNLNNRMTEKMMGSTHRQSFSASGCWRRARLVTPNTFNSEL